MIKTAGSCAILFAALFAINARAQILQSPSPPNAPVENSFAQHTVALTVPKGTPLQIALDSEVRIRKVGQPIQGHLMQPVYAFDCLALSLGTQVQGHISKIGKPSGSNLRCRS